jgi:hypothetical protein
MKVSLSHGQLIYEAGLRTPAFDLAISAVPAVKALHAAFSGRFNVTPADIHVGNAARLSEWLTRLSLFNGNWTVDFRFSGYQVTCNLLTTEADVRLAVECIGLTEEVARTIIPSIALQYTLARLSVWYRCDGGSNAVLQHMSQFTPTTLGIGPGFEGAQEVCFNIAGEVANSEERWSTRFLIEPSRVPNADLFYQIENKYLDGGKYNTLEERKNHFRQISKALSKQAALEAFES